MSRTAAGTPSFFEGLSSRSQLVDCPLRAYEVTVDRCSGLGECAAVCQVSVFGTDSSGRCFVANEELCFGCMACVAQCADGGVRVAPRDSRRYPTVNEMMR
jgi:NAD-dependent dihydropyrimidine dehydrogenase PreA subunit